MRIPAWYAWQTKGHEEQVYVDDRGTLRYRANPLVRWIVDQFNASHDYHWMQRREQSPCPSLNTMAVAFAQDAFPLEDYMQFYRDMGYSLNGFEEVFGKYFDGNGNRLKEGA